jgi:DNA-binding response OmpR family regulator
MGPPPSLPSLHLLVVEDEKSIRDGLTDVLVFRGYRVDAVADGDQALACLALETYALVLLDVMLPEVDGYTVCETLRQRGSDVPVLMLTAKGSEEDVLRGFQAGADDYVTKPFSLRELLARVEALLRRTAHRTLEEFRAGPLVVDVEKGHARGEGLDIELSPREVGMLRMLTEDPGRIISRRALLRHVWGMNNVEQVETRTVDVHIAKLRRKLGPVGLSYLETVRGQGYRWHG